MRIRFRRRLVFGISLFVMSHAHAINTDVDSSCAELLTRTNLKTAIAEWQDSTPLLKLLNETIDSNEINELAAKHLDTQQVRYTRTTNKMGDPVLEILPDRSSPSRLNQWAASLWEKHQTKFIFDINYLSPSVVGSYQLPTRSSPGAILLPVEAILDADQPSSTTVHEILHSLTIWHLKRRDPFPFYGLILVKDLNPKAVIPGSLKLNNGSKIYNKLFRFDEINTHYGQASMLIRRLKADPTRSANTLNAMKTRIMLGRRFANQTVLITRALLNGTAHYSPYQDLYTVIAKLDFKLAGTSLEVHLPLVKSQGLGDPHNREYVVEQLQSLNAGALQRAQAFDRLLKKL